MTIVKLYWSIFWRTVIVAPIVILFGIIFEKIGEIYEMPEINLAFIFVSIGLYFLAFVFACKKYEIKEL